MIHRIYRLTSAKHIEVFQRELCTNAGNLIVSPEYLSICAADLRYFFGKRSKEVMRKKLPMALIHEAVAILCYDPSGRLTPGQRLVLIPNRPGEGFQDVKANYRPSSRFLSSGDDGFLQDLIAISPERIIPVTANERPAVYALTELLSVAYNALEQLPRPPRACCIFGNGNVGFATALVFKYTYPQVPLVIVGTNPHKLQYFSFSDQTFLIDEIPNHFFFDTAFECVGGDAAENVIDLIIRRIYPQGVVSLLGVSETRVPINTRMVLEKGLTIVGHSRSERDDFIKSVSLIESRPEIQLYLNSIISEILEIHSIQELCNAFEQAETNDFKTILHWRI